ncbi:MAG: hypothetical protein HQL15_00285 [Candidatus Omnitrophica bacterium]|nr:hypothetical protein [Candidatus Omnitrophota bacterium]
MKRINSLLVLSTILSVGVSSSLVLANPTMIKAYKSVYPDAKLKCNMCHVDALPKKAEGSHEWNAYGLAVKKAAKDAGLEHPTEDTFKAAGKIEDFKGK